MSVLIPSLRGKARSVPEATRTGLVLLSALALLAMAPGLARSQPALEPEEAGADFPIQGEYSGKVETAAPMGVQVIALGAGNFKAVFLPGGLPGQGWNGKDRVEAMGTLTGGKAEFSGGGYSATVAADGSIFSGKTDKGEIFSFDKIHRKSSTEGALPPSGAIVLFDGNGVAAWKDGTASMDARKLFKPEGVSATSGAVTKQAFQSFSLHLEFRLPFMPAERAQRRGNSGIYLQGRDELQVLDSFGNALDPGADTMSAKRECGAFFEYFRPAVNMAYPPLAWQTYDIDFTAATYDAAGTIKLEPARATVRWNGVEVHTDIALANSTLLGDPQSSSPGPQRFQAYGDPVFYRNIWITDGMSSIRNRSKGMNGPQGPQHPEGRKSRFRPGVDPSQGPAGTAVFADGRAVTAETIRPGKISYSRGVTDDF